MLKAHRKTQRYISLIINNSVFLLLAICYSSFSYADLLKGNVQLHGFLTQGFFYSSDNNVYGHSDDSIAAGLTEIGLNLTYQPLDNLTFMAQGLYKRSGNVDRGSLKLDHALAELTLFNNGDSQFGLRVGRVRSPFGLYNETRDVAFTHPTILLPMGLYFDRSRTIFLSADGGQVFFKHNDDYGQLHFRFFYGMPISDNNEAINSFLALSARGTVTTKPSFVTQLRYDTNDNNTSLALSYSNTNLKYHASADDFLTSASFSVSPLVISARQVIDDLTLTAEYSLRWNQIARLGAAIAPRKFISENYYIEASYRIMPALQATVRYDINYQDINDRQGDNAIKKGLPNHLAFSRSWVLGLQWNIDEAWMVRTDYYHNHGTSWLSQADNPNKKLTVQDWDIFALQLSYRF